MPGTSGDFLPEMSLSGTFEVHNFVQFLLYDAIADEHHHEVTLKLAQVQVDMRDVAFYFNKEIGIKLKAPAPPTSPCSKHALVESRHPYASHCSSYGYA
ncbi:hypothetical protein PLICRDRAFT_179311 [Plicaturopsis crispa FD-325 SS-3]|uniref:HAM1-like N-terminal domain-containing protein n=1 Tax=Plicaturopsis crispa FD-325 SS-3 TaxID=944288 RepID=A0A0C9SKX3_PLICR|nr:hypothetical protein PLICRDRAFT_179311 [Plicaturopsis crispa FD-325 SS-3]